MTISSQRPILEVMIKFFQLSVSLFYLLTIVTHFVMVPSFCSDIRPNRTGKLDHGDPLGVCYCSCSAAPQGGHCAIAANWNPQAGAEDWYGWENEENGRHAVVHCHWWQEEKDHTWAGMGSIGWSFGAKSGAKFQGMRYWKRSNRLKLYMRWWSITETTPMRQMPFTFVILLQINNTLCP